MVHLGVIEFIVYNIGSLILSNSTSDQTTWKGFAQ